MTPKEYKAKLEALKKQELELAREFIEDNPFKELEGKLVNLTTGFRHRKVLFIGADFTKAKWGEPTEPALFYHELKKDGSPRKNARHILVRFYDEKLDKIEKICRK